MHDWNFAGYLDWKRSSGWLESWEGLLFMSNVLTTCAEAIFRVKTLKWRWLPLLIDFFNQGMWLLGSNHFLIFWVCYNLNHRIKYCHYSKFQALLDATYVVECQLVNEDFPEDRSAKEIKHLISKCLFVLLILIFQSEIKILVRYLSALMNFVLLEILFQVNLLLLLL